MKTTITSGNDNDCYVFLRFGKIKSSERYDEIQLTWIPIIMTYSSGGSFPVSSTDEKRHQYEWLSPYVKYVQPLGVKMIPEFLKNTAVYIKPNSVPEDNQRNSWNSNKLILALARNLPVVTPEFTKTLYTLLQIQILKQTKGSLFNSNPHLLDILTTFLLSHFRQAISLPLRAKLLSLLL